MFESSFDTIWNHQKSKHTNYLDQSMLLIIKIETPGCGCINNVLIAFLATWAPVILLSWLWQFVVCDLHAFMDHWARGMKVRDFIMARLNHDSFAPSSAGIGILVLLCWLCSHRSCTAQGSWKPPWLHNQSHYACLWYMVLIFSAGVWCTDLVFSACVRYTEFVLSVCVGCINLVFLV